MNHWIILPILVPAVVAPLLVIAVRYDLVLARVFSLSSAIFLLLTSLFLANKASGGVVTTYAIGNWRPPFGIVLVLDQLSALMLILTAVIGLAVIIYSMGDWDKRGEHFHPLMQFQLMGLNGAFLTGDLFNLFVFFEVLLIASYGLMVHGGGAARIRAGLQYVIVNLTGSTLFLMGLALIYGTTGTLNLADLYGKSLTVDDGNRSLLDVGIALLWIVFGIKSAWFPLHFWLPGTYSNAPGPVAALFSIMTKVGVYAILRVQPISTPMLSEGQYSSVLYTTMLVCAIATILIGAIGAVGAKSLGQQTSFLALLSMGIIFQAIIYADVETQVAGIYYLVHSTLTVASMFFIVDLLVRCRRGQGDALVFGSKFEHQSLIGAAFFVVAIAIVGLPPLSGFIGKLLMLRALAQYEIFPWIWAAILIASLLALIAVSRSGSLLFWKCGAVKEFDDNMRSTDPMLPFSTESRANFAGPLTGLICLCITILSLTFLAQPVLGQIERATLQMQDIQGYKDSVSNTGGK